MPIRVPIKIHGGKSYLKNFIIERFPRNYQSMRYTEVYGGGGSVLLNKLPSKEETYNDLDKSLAHLFYCLKNHSDVMLTKLKDVTYSIETFNKAITSLRSTDIVTLGPDPDKAIDELIARRMSRGGLKNAFSWSKRLRGGKPGDENAWETFKTQLYLVCDRLQNVTIKNMNGVDLIIETDGADTLHYCDPPYLPETRTANKTYAVEMTETDHEKLAECLNSVKGKVLLSGYYSQMYSRLYKSWRLEAREMPNHSSQAKKKNKRLECLWANF